MEQIERKRLAVALCLARAGGRLSVLAGMGAGTSLPGVLLLRLAPSCIRRQAALLTDGVVVVSGTNGKTTTAAMIRAILAGAGRSVVSNRSGANLRPGIAAALAAVHEGGATGVFEVDEAVLPQAVAELEPSVLVLTNLFRDQLDRFGEPEHVAGLLRRAGEALPAGAVVVANADDPQLWSAIDHLDPLGFGVTRCPSDARPSEAGEPELCPACGAGLEFARRTIANLGAGRCRRCGWVWAPPAFQARMLLEFGLAGVLFDVADIPIQLPIGGVHNVYNAVAALAAAAALGLSPVRGASALEAFAPRFGRAETLTARGRTVWLGLIKNPAGAGTILDEISGDPNVRAVVISVADRSADGRDVSWIWDAPFERLLARPVPVVPSGPRSRDVALRLKYAGVAAERSQPDPLTAVHRAVDLCPPGGTVAVLATYTAMLDLREALAGSRRLRVLDGVSSRP